MERLICRDILLFKDNQIGYLFFPYPITDLCVHTSVELKKGEGKTFPPSGFPIEFKKKQKNVAASAGDGVWQLFMLEQQVVWKFQKDKFEWEKKFYSKNFKGKFQGDPPSFPKWVLEDEIDEKEAKIRTPAHKSQTQEGTSGQEKEKNGGC